MRVVISQSMLFPWVGMLEQLQLADIYVRYDDVQFSKGSFVNRVQIKAPEGIKWMTVPLPGLRLGQRIEEVEIDSGSAWRQSHRQLIRRSLAGTPHENAALELMETVYSAPCRTIADLAHASLMALVNYFGLCSATRFCDVRDLGISGASSERVLDVVRAVGGNEYVTGHGASRYLDHSQFEKAGITVRYMNYQRLPYPQLHGAFTPYVSALDLVANCGPEGERFIVSETIDWREFSHEST